MQITEGTLNDTHTNILHTELTDPTLSIQAGSVVLDQKLNAVYRNPNSNDTLELKQRRAIELYYGKINDPEEMKLYAEHILQAAACFKANRKPSETCKKMAQTPFPRKAKK